MATPKLAMDELVAQQSQPEVTHNEALRVLDGLVQCNVIDKDLTAPPGGESDGDTYIVGASATGDWSGEDGNIAYYKSSAYIFLDPSEGWFVYVQDEDSYYTYAGASAGWIKFADGAGGSQSYDIGGYFAGTPTAGEVILRLPMTRGVSFGTNMSGSEGAVGTAPSSTATLTIERDGTEFGEISISTGGVVTFTTDSNYQDLVAGDILTITGPNPASDFVGLGFNLKGTKT